MVLDAGLVAESSASGSVAGDDDPALEFLPILVYGEGADAPHARRLATRSREARSCARSARRSACSSRRASSCIATSRRCPNRTGWCSRRLHDADEVLRGKRVMIVDDDMRNIFALTSLLEDQRDGRRVARQRPRRDPLSAGAADVDVVLMDIMMPEIDGIDTIREIRKIHACRDLADHRRHGQGDEGRPREMHGSGRLGLPVEAGRHRADDRQCCGHGWATDGASSSRAAPARARPSASSRRGTGRTSSSSTIAPTSTSSSRDPRGARPESRPRELRRGGAEGSAEARLRGHPARRQHAGLDGLETAALIRRRKRSAHIPIIFITADYGDEARIAQAYALGAVDFMVSPIVPEILRTKVKVFVELYLLAQQAKQAGRGARRARRRARGARRGRARQPALGVPGERQRGARPLARRDGGDARAASTGHPVSRRHQRASRCGSDAGIDARTEVAWCDADPAAALHTESVTSVECGWWRDGDTSA